MAVDRGADVRLLFAIMFRQTVTVLRTLTIVDTHSIERVEVASVLFLAEVLTIGMGPLRFSGVAVAALTFSMLTSLTERLCAPKRL